MREREQTTLTILPWSMSSTGSWGPESGLDNLRDLPSSDLAEMLWLAGLHVQITAVFELMGHGNPRKAAATLREIASNHPEAEEVFRQHFGPMSSYLLEHPLEDIPSCPKEFPKHVKIEFAQ